MEGAIHSSYAVDFKEDVAATNNALIITYTFAPALEPGAIRMSKLARYLPDYGCHPIVLTSSGGFAYAVGLEAPQSDFELVRVPDPDPIKRIVGRSVDAGSGLRSRSSEGRLMWNLKRYYSQLVFPDRDFLWGFRAAAAAIGMIRRRRITTIYSSSPTMTNHLAAYIAHRYTGIPWVAEFRDLWSQSDAYADKWCWRRALDRRFEQRMLRSASRIVTISNELRDAFRQQCPSIDPEKFDVITNGFDKEDQERLPEFECQPEFSVTYAGTFYGGKRDPSSFFAALREFLSDDNIDRAAVRINIIGKPESFVKELASRYGVQENVRLLGVQPFSATLERLARSYLLLLMTNPGYPEMPLKVFDYFCARRPILAICPPASELASRISEAGAGVVVEHSNVPAIRECLAHYYGLWRRGDPGYHGREAKMLQYWRSSIAERVAAVVRQCSLASA